MSKREEIFDKYKNKGFTSGGELYLQAADAINFIRECEDNNLAVIGVEVVIKDNLNLIPQIDKVYDGSRDKTTTSDNWEEYRELTNNEAIRFIETTGNNKDEYFTLVVTSKEG